MNNELPAWVGQIQSAWFALGTMIAVIGATQGINLPEWLLSVFSEEFINNAMIFLGMLIAFIQYVRSKFTKEVDAEVKSASMQRRSKLKYALNPFKMTI